MVVPGRGPQLKTEPQALLTLLRVQEADLLSQRLIERRDALPEAARAKELAAAAAAARDRAVMRRTEARDLQREVSKFEDEVEKVRARAKRDDELMLSGEVASARQLTDLQHEIASLQRRQAELEDAELELLQQAEDAARVQQEAEQERDALAEEADTAIAQRDAALRGLGADYRQTVAQRTELAADLPADLLALYEKIRADRDGVGAAEFTANQCGACRLQMIPADLAQLRTAPVDEVLRCEECRRILVRTALLRP